MAWKISRNKQKKWLHLAVGAALLAGVSGVLPGMASAAEVTVQGGENEFYSSVGEKFMIPHDGWPNGGWPEKWYSVFDDDASKNNTITFSNFTAPDYGVRVAGGYGAGVTVSGNTITVENSVISGQLAGGYNSAAGEVSGNVVTIGAGTTTNGSLDVFGGYSNTENNTTDVKNNTVNILTAITLQNLKGGENKSYWAGMNGNTLNIAAAGVQATYFGAFENINFLIPQNIGTNDVMLTINGDATNLGGVNIGVGMQQGASMTVGDSVNLMKNNSGINNAPTTATPVLTTKAPVSLITDKQYNFSLSTIDDDKMLVAKLDSITEAPAQGESGGENEGDNGALSAEMVASSQRLKSLVETQAAVATVLNSGSDMLADAGFEQAGAAAVAADSAGKFAPFAAMGGSSLRAESGSHVDTKGFGLNVGFAKEVRRGKSTYLFGPVVEYGRGSYDSYQDNGIKADGSSSYWGVGLLGRQTNDDGVYYEGSLRLGKVKADYSGNLVDRTAEYDSSSKYWAGHLGLGRVYKLKGSNSLDGYVKCFFSHQDGDTVTVNLNNGTTDEISFSSTDSQRFRIGARLSHQVNPESSVYGGLAYQYETQGESRATYHGFDTAAPSVKGGQCYDGAGLEDKAGQQSRVSGPGSYRLGWQAKGYQR
ncbi:autotransporter outer membrane beta-barrel domain-containing protein [Selenomonas sp. AE3005]|uniref:autotransporter outer membrane beta-barrel domain-containing protein n=1 Tax=Selenomonas sp. AE3005 TaxID=1485543 RepID=UPI0025D9D7E3|nr:autotransporter outer membrane beta-barrel domain-containing protein [Selenomonas sp. AE3005]